MRMRPGRFVSNAFALVSILLMCAGCAQQMQSIKDDNVAGNDAPVALRDIKVSDDASLVEISADKPLIFTSYSLTAPPKVVIDLAQTDPGAVASQIAVNKGGIRQITVSRHGSGGALLSRIEIILTDEHPFSVTADPIDKGKILVTFAKLPVKEKLDKTEGTIEEKMLKVEDLATPGGAIAELKPAQKVNNTPDNPTRTEQAAIATAPMVNSATVAGAASVRMGKVLTAVEKTEDGVDVFVTGGVSNYNAFKLADPFRLVLDLSGVKNGVNAKTVNIDSFGIGKARLGIAADKVRIVFDVVTKALPPYKIVKSEAGLKILFKEFASTAPTAAGANTAVEPAKQTGAGTAEAVKEPVKPAALASRPIGANVSAVESIEFKSTGEYAQIAIRIGGACMAEKPRKVAGGWSLTLKNCRIPKHLQRKLDTTGFASSVKEVTPYQVKVRDGYNAKFLVKLRRDVPFTFSQEGDLIVWGIKNPENGLTVAPLPPAAKAPPVMAHHAKAVTSLEKDPPADKQQSLAQSYAPKKVYTGRKVTLEFSDADIRKILQLIESISDQNFIIDEGVTGVISLKLVNVPWDQALDVIMDSKGLGKEHVGNIVYIKPTSKLKTQEQEEVALKEDREKRMEPEIRAFDVNFATIGDVVTQFESLKSSNRRTKITPDARTNRVIVFDLKENLERMANLLKQLDIPEKQVMIEARIVEASSTFTRDMGVQWGLHAQDSTASFLGINQLDTGFGGEATAAPTTGTFGPGGSLGMSFGKLGGNIQLDLRLSAAASAGLIKIISTPKVVTLNNKSATIAQGQSIPYQTTSAEGTQTQFVQATLSLTVTPHVTADGNIGLKINATNNSAGTGSPPSINTKMATTELQVMNGETTVIGGIYVDNDTESDSGVPFLMDIPLLGWLFKSNSKSKSKSELLIFITPRIVN
jgi:type IV pilus assembly protein PilQ